MWNENISGCVCKSFSRGAFKRCMFLVLEEELRFCCCSGVSSSSSSSSSLTSSSRLLPKNRRKRTDVTALSKTNLHILHRPFTHASKTKRKNGLKFSTHIANTPRQSQEKMAIEANATNASRRRTVWTRWNNNKKTSSMMKKLFYVSRRRRRRRRDQTSFFLSFYTLVVGVFSITRVRVFWFLNLLNSFFTFFFFVKNAPLRIVTPWRILTASI